MIIASLAKTFNSFNIVKSIDNPAKGIISAIVGNLAIICVQIRILFFIRNHCLSFLSASFTIVLTYGHFSTAFFLTVSLYVNGMLLSFEFACYTSAAQIRSQLLFIKK